MNQLGLWIDYLLKKQRWLIHVAFWLLILLLYSVFFGRANSNYLQTFFFVGLLMPITIGTTYLLNYYLVPHYLLKERVWYFLLYFIYTLLGAMLCEMMIAMFTFILLTKANIRDMSPASIDLFFLLTSLLMVVFLAVAIKLLEQWHQTKEGYQALLRDKLESELRFLKAQLNPHFLFNTLNNLYFLTTEKSDKAPQAILQLSEILDYVLHSGKISFVPLERELKQVENYVALEMLRYAERVTVTTQFKGDLTKFNIGPMILITLIENAFKHGVMPTVQQAWIKLSVAGEGSELIISVSNSVSGIKTGNGIGLENLKSQLNHLYPSRFSMHLSRPAAHEFNVELRLKASSYGNEI